WPSRGLSEWKYLFLSSEKPFGLYRAWRYLPIEGKSFVYPALKKEITLPELKKLGIDGEFSFNGYGNGEFCDLLHSAGEDIRRISWKHYARTGEIFIRQGEDLKSPVAELSWQQSDEDKEGSLSALASKMVLCYRENIPFIFEINGKKIGPGSSIAFLET